jgi:hypothetical protein
MFGGILGLFNARRLPPRPPPPSLALTRPPGASGSHVPVSKCSPVQLGHWLQTATSFFFRPPPPVWALTAPGARSQGALAPPSGGEVLLAYLPPSQSATANRNTRIAQWPVLLGSAQLSAWRSRSGSPVSDLALPSAVKTAPPEPGFRGPFRPGVARLWVTGAASRSLGSWLSLSVVLSSLYR